MSVRINESLGLTSVIITVYNDLDNTMCKINYYKNNSDVISFDEIYSRILDDVTQITKSKILRFGNLKNNKLDNLVCIISDDLKSVIIKQKKFDVESNNIASNNIAYLHSTETHYIKI